MYAAFRPLVILDLRPDIGARILRVQLGILAQQFLGALVVDHRGLDRHLHDLVASLAGARIRHALFTETELLPVARALGNLQQRAAVDGRHLDLGSQARFIDAHRHGDLDVVAVAAEKRMRIHAHCNVEIARRSAMGAGVTLARHAQPRTLLRARWNAYLHSFRLRDAAVAVTSGAAVAQPPRAFAARATQAEPHRSGRLRYVPAAVALRADGVGARTGACAVASGAHFLAGDVQPDLRSFDGLPEVNTEPVFEVGTLFRLRLAA